MKQKNPRSSEKTAVATLVVQSCKEQMFVNALEMAQSKIFQA